MSSKATEKKSAGTEVTHEERWRSGRPRFFGRQNVHLGRDKKWHFSGQQADEEVHLVVRKHWWFLVKPALPFIASCILLGLVLFATVRFPNPLFPWTFFEIVAIALFFVTLGWFVWRYGIVMYHETHIVTNKRIISSRGLLEPIRQATPIEKITQVGVGFEPWQFILRYGLVHIYLAGGDFYMKDADERYKVRNPKGRLGPRRPFGIFRNVPAEVHYTSGEFTVKYIQRSHYVLFRQLALPVLGLLFVLPLAVYIPASGNPAIQGALPIWFVVMTALLLGLLATIFLIYINYIDDVYIFTNKRIIDVERRFLFFYEMSTQIEYKNIKNMKVTVPNVLQRLLDVGDVRVEVTGASSVTLSTVDHPFVVIDDIFEIQKNKEEAEKAKKTNDEKKELHMWFGKVVSKLVETAQLKGAPNLQKMDLLEAMQCANELGFLVTVADEAPSEEVPGQVIHQSPPPGTAITAGGEIQVVLSRKPTLVEQGEVIEMDMM